MRYRPKWFYAQSAVVPYRLAPDSPHILLITSRRGTRWTVPKGVIDPGLTARESAAKEAFEEAGVRGEVERERLGAFEYEKWGGTCRVEVYPLHVREVLDVWPESRRRQRRWLPLEEAIEQIGWASLRPILRTLAERIRHQQSPDR